jgi:PadR family transcriptional regulator PadR
MYGAVYFGGAGAGHLASDATGGPRLSPLSRADRRSTRNPAISRVGCRHARTVPNDAPTPSRPPRPHKELMTAWLLLLLDGGASYGYELRRALQAHELSIDPSVVYRTLRKLERIGWVESRWMQPVAGPRRRFYRLTRDGRRNLDEIARLIRSARDTQDAFLRAYAQIASDTPRTHPAT